MVEIWLSFQGLRSTPSVSLSPTMSSGGRALLCRRKATGRGCKLSQSRLTGAKEGGETPPLQRDGRPAGVGARFPRPGPD